MQSTEGVRDGGAGKHSRRHMDMKTAQVRGLVLRKHRRLSIVTSIALVPERIRVVDESCFCGFDFRGELRVEHVAFGRTQKTPHLSTCLLEGFLLGMLFGPHWGSYRGSLGRSLIKVGDQALLRKILHLDATTFQPLRRQLSRTTSLGLYPRWSLMRGPWCTVKLRPNLLRQLENLRLLRLVVMSENGEAIQFSLRV